MPMKFLVDMCEDVRVGTWLQDQGHDAKHLRDEGLQTLANRKIFQKAIDVLKKSSQAYVRAR
jgi:predicted nuclease of predicted toxin-antitoxin system